MLGNYAMGAAAMGESLPGLAAMAPAPSGTITSQPAPSGQTQQFVGTTSNATSGVVSLAGTNGGTSVGPVSFLVNANAFDFSLTGLTPGDYVPTLTVSGPGGGPVAVSGATAFSIMPVDGGGVVTDPPPPDPDPVIPGQPIMAKTIIDSVAATLQDSGNDIWGRDELLGFLNDGQRDTCLLKGDAYVKYAPYHLGSGTVQMIPADGHQFVRLVRNMGTAGTQPGRAPRAIALAIMDEQDPNWHIATPGATVLEYCLDPADPKRFYVSPPQPQNNRGYVDMVYHAIPEDLASEDDNIVLDVIYKTALEHYMLYRAYLKEGEYSNPAGAIAHRAEFLALLGVRQAQEQAGGQ